MEVHIEAEVKNEETVTNEGKEEKVLMTWRDNLVPSTVSNVWIKNILFPFWFSGISIHVLTIIVTSEHTLQVQ